MCPIIIMGVGTTGGAISLTGKVSICGAMDVISCGPGDWKPWTNDYSRVWTPFLVYDTSSVISRNPIWAAKSK